MLPIRPLSPLLLVLLLAISGCQKAKPKILTHLEITPPSGPVLSVQVSSPLPSKDELSQMPWSLPSSQPTPSFVAEVLTQAKLCSNGMKKGDELKIKLLTRLPSCTLSNESCLVRLDDDKAIIRGDTNAAGKPDEQLRIMVFQLALLQTEMAEQQKNGKPTPN